ncbi:chemotaxis-related protein WspD [Methylopila capsulata]|uniref:Chemotaxis protein CheW n=1 Tax=Methylopila capsulata TaxID=61654 RepID=A0A9W6IV02_9HYPH|nr:chemotaxis protein CheW [Methylopila capsulata]MBM7850387.1 chemotaxis-related protein WspD [Methylopila capsulata]GLK55680.1 chew domain protein [Methylopila capsulata]
MTGAGGGGGPGGSSKAASAEIAGGLLERPLPAGYCEDWARHFAGLESEGAAEDEGADRAALLFRIGDEWLALPTDHLHEVAQPRRTHSLPHRRDELVLGIVNVRGELLVCVSLAALLGISAAGTAEAGERSRAGPRLVVIGRDGRRAAFPVDEVHGVHRYAARDVLALPATIGKAASSYAVEMIAWSGRAIGRLDDALILETLDRSMS